VRIEWGFVPVPPCSVCYPTPPLLIAIGSVGVHIVLLSVAVATIAKASMSLVLGWQLPYTCEWPHLLQRFVLLA